MKAFIFEYKGKIVYCTCSVLPEENYGQVVKFCDKHGFEIENGSHFARTLRVGVWRILFSDFSSQGIINDIHNNV